MTFPDGQIFWLTIDAVMSILCSNAEAPLGNSGLGFQEKTITLLYFLLAFFGCWFVVQCCVHSRLGHARKVLIRSSLDALMLAVLASGGGGQKIWWWDGIMHTQNNGSWLLEESPSLPYCLLWKYVNTLKKNGTRPLIPCEFKADWNQSVWRQGLVFNP